MRQGVWAFVRRGAGVARRGVYVRTPGRPPRLLAPVVATQTVTTPGRVAYVVGSVIGARRISGRGPAVVVSAAEPGVPVSLVGTRYRFGWLRREAGGMRVVWTERLSWRAPSIALRLADRLLPATALSITTNDAVPDKYLDERGIELLDPRLGWGS
ncbi:unannotated protein [freshwater metagenome]|uniref:Unannotated protein n=1 Tax=freshwater metagenome TaxID=449393 RepID=A0A6J7HVR1_9ZZZZ|nr:hypothetical protein [Actinomycetota bacterium]